MNAIEEIKQRAALWAEAIVSNDAVAIGTFMTDDWQMVSQDGITTKEAFLAVIRSGMLTHNRMDFDETTVRVYGDTAWVVNKGTSAGMYDGAPFSFYEWSTDIYVRQNDQWLCALTMLTIVRPQ